MRLIAISSRSATDTCDSAASLRLQASLVCSSGEPGGFGTFMEDRRGDHQHQGHAGQRVHRRHLRGRPDGSISDREGHGVPQPAIAERAAYRDFRPVRSVSGARAPPVVRGTRKGGIHVGGTDGSGGGTRTPDTRIMIPGGSLFSHGFLVNRCPNPPLHINSLPMECKPLIRRKRLHSWPIPTRSGYPRNCA